MIYKIKGELTPLSQILDDPKSFGVVEKQQKRYHLNLYKILGLMLFLDKLIPL